MYWILNEEDTRHRIPDGGNGGKQDEVLQVHFNIILLKGVVIGCY